MNPTEATERTKLKTELDELLRRIGSIAKGFSLEQHRRLNSKFKDFAEQLPTAFQR
jgi:hypothetical protein